MRLWLVERTDDPDYDEYDGFVIAALDADRAKKFADEKEKRAGGWTARSIGTANAKTRAGVVLGSFNAG